jgi:hypothetical protein
MSGSFPLRKIVPMHVVQVEISIAWEQKQLSNYSVPNDQNQYSARPNGHNWKNNNKSNQNNWYNKHEYNQNF